MRNSIKQLLRTPFKAVLFSLLLAASTALLVLGAQLWTDVELDIKDVENTYTTIGMVKQKATGTKTDVQWDAATKSYTVYPNEVYTHYLSVDVLDFDGAEYIQPPERRPYYLSYMPDYKVSVGVLADPPFVIEFTPYETCVPTEPVQVQITQVLYGNAPNGDVWICDHYTETPITLEKGEKYIAQAFQAVTTHPNNKLPAETIAYNLLHSSQTDVNGILLKSTVNAGKEEAGTLNPPAIEGVTEDFYNSERWRYWKSMQQTLEWDRHNITVVPTNALDLLASFHNKAAKVSEGRTITEEEFESGARVCMVPVVFAKLNSLQIGDKIPLRLYVTKYYGFASQDDMGWSGGTVTASGDPYSIFFEEEFEIVGTYVNSTIAVGMNVCELGNTTAIIPMNSVTTSSENNIQSFDAMQPGNTTFQIKNGTADQFMEAFHANVPESEQLEITFDDNGYMLIMKNLNNMRHVAILLFVIGLITALTMIVLMLYFFIVRQKKRTAIERSLGMTKQQCRVSMLSGILLLSAIAIILGTVCSVFFVDLVETMDLANQSERTYSTDFSLWATEEADVMQEEFDEEEPDAATLPVQVFSPILLLGFTATLSVILVNRNLKAEPILMLSSRSE